MLNMYEFDIIRKDNISMSGCGVTVQIFTPNLELAEKMLKYQKKRRHWRGVIKLLDVQLNQTTITPRTMPPPPNYEEGPSLWYMNHNMGMGLRLQGGRYIPIAESV